MGIQILSPTLANQIAAGEVIERPASVVKELIENAIDAGSTQIEIHVEEAGLNKIQVIDNGAGIPSTEVVRAFERHATSKIFDNEDLFRIRSLGFRGEALPSIASVSECLVETATDSGPGTRLFLKGGDVKEHTSGPSRQGTSITITQLFYNTPARLKYIKSIKTELSHIADVVNRSALAHPDIAFRFINEGNVYLRTPGNGDLKQAAAGVYGIQTAKKLRHIAAENRDFTISGLVSLPELTRAGRNYVTLVVNGRYVRSYALTNALAKGYGSKLMIGRFPLAVVNVQLDPLLLDVNVHPSKQEIRISKEEELVDLLKRAVAEAMEREVRIPHGLDSFPHKKEQSKNRNEQTTLFWKQQNKAFSTSDQEKRVENESKSNGNSDENDWDSLVNVVKDATEPELEEADARFGSFEHTSESFSELHVEDAVETARKQLARKKTSNELEHFPDLDYIGQMHGTYLLAQNEDGFYMIDQHAAQERIRYEYYRKEIAERGTVLQELLVPLMLDYPLTDALLIKEKMEMLEEAGIHLESFGQNSFLLRSHPSWFLQGQEEATVREMIDFLLEHHSLTTAAFREATAIMMSCKRSIKANHYISDTEARQLLVDLEKAENPYNCPHGRPVMIQFSMYEIERMFKRIQDH